MVVEQWGKSRNISASILAAGLLIFLGPTAQASVDDFVFERFDGVYELNISAEGKSLLQTTETLVALFPDYDQNRGIARYLPAQYLGQPLPTEVISVTDEQGTERPWSVTREGSAFVIESVVPPGEFARGPNTYVVTYRQENVVRDFVSSTGVQEFYWDINGSGWPQPFDVVSATVIIPAFLAESLVEGGDSCYQGPEGSTEVCDIVRRENPDGSIHIRAEAKALGPYETMTIAIGFAPDTFVAPRADQQTLLATIAQGIGLVAAAVSVVWAFVIRRKHLSDAPGRPVIIPEYLPPQGGNLFASSILRHQQARIPLAGLLELAVSRKIQLTEVPGFGRRWALIRRDHDLTPGDVEFLTVLFGSVPAVGESTALPKNSPLVAKRLDAFVAEQKKRMVNGGLTLSVPFVVRLGPLLVAALAGALAVAGFVFVGEEDVGGLVWAVGAATLALVSLSVFLVSKTPLGSTGAHLRDELKGLRVYIRLAEKDRLHYLQSPQGAVRERVSPDDSRQVLKLYERLLPWAVVLGEEKRWVKELDRLYRDQSPDWMTGTGRGLMASLASFSSATQSSFRSSSSGGTSGGGSAGGGGGGGGGGGR